MTKFRIGKIYYNKNCYYKLICVNSNLYLKKVTKNINVLLNEKEILDILSTYDNFPKIHELNLENKAIIYDYIYGMNLSEINIANFEMAVKLMIKIIDVLKIVHDNDIVHCDLKPSNIMINGNKIYLIDFGISQHHKKNKFPRYGSARYCSPEQYYEEVVDNRSDIYSLGIILYKLVMGKELYEKESKKYILREKLLGNLPKIIDDIPNIPIEIEYIFEKATKLNKNERYENVMQMKKDLEKILIKYY